MRRRAYLASLGAGVAGLAGCLGVRAPAADASSAGDSSAPTAAEPPDTGTGTPATRTDSGSPGRPGEVPRLDDVDLPLDLGAFTYATGMDAIPAITEPAFGRDWSGVTVPGYSGEAATPRLGPGDEIIGVVRDGEARAYPRAILDRHEIVNDDLDGPLLVSYCPLCGSGVTAVRRVRGQPTVFGVSGKLWKSDLVMYDDLTESYWSQILATAVRGPATGDQLELVPSTLTTWGAWQAEHPETRVLRPPPESGTIDGSDGGYYVGDTYASYEESRLIGVSRETETGGALHPKARVLGVTDGEAARAYPMEAVRAAGGVVTDTVGTLPVVVAIGPGDAMVGYDRRVDGTVLQFARGDDRHLRAGGSRWRTLSGVAVDGPHDGTTLVPANARPPMFWFAWRDFHPGTDRYGGPEPGTAGA